MLDILGPRHSFEGGLFLPDHKSQTAKQATQTLKAVGELRIPLSYTRQQAFDCLVRPGQRVLRHQRLSQPLAPEGAPVFAPTSGTIREICPVRTVHEGMIDGLVLEADGKDETTADDLRWHSDSLSEVLFETGVVCPANGVPAHVLLRQAIRAGVTDLIVNAVESEPFLTAELRTLVEHTGRLIDTTCEMADAIGVSRVIFAAPYRHRRVIKNLEAEAAGRHVEIAALAHKYPQCHPHILVKTLLDREVPPGASLLDMEVLVLSLGMIRAAGEALWRHQPCTDVVMTVAGDGVEHAGTFRVPIGTPLRRVAEAAGGSWGPLCISGGPFTGRQIEHDDAVVSFNTQALLLLTATQKPTSTACVHCGWCVEDCPVGLDPVWLTSREAPRSGTYREEVNACIDCALCTYVCPSQIPLAAQIREAREQLNVRTGN